MLNESERVEALKQMKLASSQFYINAIKIGNHPFIEFTGLMNEYIIACETAHNNGIDFSECSRHSGVDLPLESHMIDYLNEKLDCIFTGRCKMI